MHQIEFKQQLNVELEEIWDFIKDPSNLEKITPSKMGFRIKISPKSKEMYPGMMIGYTVKPILNIAMEWLTEITHVEHLKYFVDEQRIGPYTIWHHEHILESNDNGVLMTDIITYRIPFGFLGKLVNHIFIKKQLQEIFAFRKAVLHKKYNSQ